MLHIRSAENCNSPISISIKVKYKEIIKLIDSYKLIPGQNYHITDYKTTVSSNVDAIVNNE